MTSYLDIPNHTRQKWTNQLAENFNIYMHAENQLHPTLYL